MAFHSAELMENSTGSKTAKGLGQLKAWRLGETRAMEHLTAYLSAIAMGHLTALLLAQKNRLSGTLTALRSDEMERLGNWTGRNSAGRLESLLGMPRA